MALSTQSSRVRPGPRNAITDVAGLRVGQAHDEGVRSGVSVLLPDSAWIAACDIRGGGPGTRETDALRPGNLVEHVHALVFSGGSAFGLSAADGVMGWLAARGLGFDTGSARVPIVPAAILYDLANGGEKNWGQTSPYPDLGRAACDQASPDIQLGRAGAGFGARAGALPGGIGTASAFDPETGATVGAFVAVNSFGAVTMGDGTYYAWPHEIDGEFGGRTPSGAVEDPTPHFPKLAGARTNTTLVAVATDAALDRAQAGHLAVMAQDGVARAIRPAHTPFDGDSVFALASGQVGPVDALGLARLGSIAADCTARAIARGVYEAGR